MSETAVHVASGKVREMFELDEDRLLLVASDRISVFDVVLPTEIPDKGRVLDRPLGLLVRAHAGDRAQPPSRPAARTGARPRRAGCRMLPIECVVRGYLAGSGWKDYQRTGATSAGIALPRGPAGVRTSFRSRSSRRRRRPRPATTRTSRSRPGDRARRRDAARTRSSASSIELYRLGAEHAARARDHPRRHEVRVRPGRRTIMLVLGDEALHARLLPLLAGGRVRARPPTALVRQAVRARLRRGARLGQDRPRPGAARTRSSTAPAHATSRRSSGSRASRSRSTSRIPRWCFGEEPPSSCGRSRASSTRRARRSAALSTTLGSRCVRHGSAA